MFKYNRIYNNNHTLDLYSAMCLPILCCIGFNIIFFKILSTIFNT